MQYFSIDLHNLKHYGGILNTVEPRLADTPEMQPSMVMRALCSVRNDISVDLHTYVHVQTDLLKCGHLANL